MTTRNEEHDIKNSFQCSDHQGYIKNACTKFHVKILIGTEVLEENSPKMSPKIPPKAPQEDLDMEKNSAVTPKGTTGTSVQNFK